MSMDEKFLQDLQLELQKEFLEEVSFLIEQCEESYLLLENPDHRTEELNKIFRLAHSLKGTGASVGYTDIAGFAHVVEDCLSVLRARPELVTAEIISLLLRSGDAFKVRIQGYKTQSKEPWDVEGLKAELIATTKRLLGAETELALQPEAAPTPTSTPTAASAAPEAEPRHDVPATKAQASLVKIDPARIEGVLDLVGELVVLKGQLLQEYSDVTNARQGEVLALLDKTVRDLQDKTLFMRLTALKPLFLRVQRIVRDLSIKLQKPVDFTMSGEEIEIDRTMIELLSDPLVHLSRNALDHGIEPPGQRTAAGKPERAAVRMSARQSGGQIVIELSDDGGGIARERVVRKAVERGLLPESRAASLPEQEVFGLLFMPGFSTAEKVTDLSGRGVGLDVVKSSVEKLKGQIQVESTVDRGTTFRLSLPLTTAITDGIIVLIQDQRFVVPMNAIRELVQIKREHIHQLSETHHAVLIRDRTLPLIPMQEVLSGAASVSGTPLAPPQARRETELVLVIDHLGTPLALQVDGVIGQSQVVVKALAETFRQAVGLAGASILGDGKIALVLDIDGLSKQLRARHAASPSGNAPEVAA